MDRDGQGRLYDGDTVRCPTTPPVSRRELVYGWICAGIVVLAPLIRRLR